jgi:hypothetical protein
MRARRIIEVAAFGPEVVGAAGAAFDAAWNEITVHFDAETREEAREHLAKSIISAAQAGCTDVDELRKAGLDSMAQRYPATRPSHRVK